MDPLEQRRRAGEKKFRVSSARKAAYEILSRVESRQNFASDLLQTRLMGLRADDRRLLTELVMGVLRWQGELDYQIERLSGKPLSYFDPEITIILRLGIYQIRFLQKVPKPAAVNEAVKLVKAARKGSAAGLVNAVLRKCRPAPRPPGATMSAGGRHRVGIHRADPEILEGACRSVPKWVLERWEQHFGSEPARSLALASTEIPPTTLRVLGGATQVKEMQSRLASAEVQTRPGRYAETALVVESGDIHSSEIWREGQVVIQDEASQLVSTLVAPRPGQHVLDVCAAPGMKTGQLAAAMGRGVLVASDLSARRLRTIARLLSAHPGVLLHIVRLDATNDLPFRAAFDRILLDAPCSGTGTLARNPEIKSRILPHDLKRLQAAQRAMLGNALKVLAPGGRLVYATCSLEPEENEQVVETVLESCAGFRALVRDELLQEFPRLAELFDQKGYFRTRPDLHGMDGFFAAVIRPRESSGQRHIKTPYFSLW